jgi:YVTN family beta-propeller protein
MAAAGLVLSAPLLAAQTLITDVTVGTYPVAIAVNANSNKIYVVNQQSNNVTVIDGATDLTATVATGSFPMALAINSLTNKIYVANGNGNSVTVIDGNTLAATSLNVGQRPQALAVNSTTNRIYVANFVDATVSVIDGATNAVATIAVGTRPCAVAVDEVSNQIYVANYRSRSVSVIDGATGSVTAVSVGLYPKAVAVDAVRNLIYVANSGADTATIIDGVTRATTTVMVGAWPVAVDVDSLTGKAYFAIAGDPGAVTMVDGLNDSTVSLRVGPYPAAIAVDSGRSRIYTANQGDNSASMIAGASVDPLQFVPVTPCRLVDTRHSPGPFGGPAVDGGTSRSFALPESDCGIPATALAYSLNVTAVPHGSLGYLTIWPTGESQPLVSTLNSLDGRVKANAAIVPAGAAGAISVFTSDTTNVVLDINGYFELPNAQTLQFYPLTPCRVLDTRNQTGHLGGPYLHGTRERDFPVRESGCPVPASALAYSINFTVVPWQSKPLGYLSVWAAGGNQPLVSTLNNLTATVVANAAIVPVGVGGAIAVYPDQDTDLVGDIDGYFAAPGDGGLSLYPTVPCRVIDTRNNGGSFSGQRNPSINVVASSCSIPASAGGYVFNVTTVPVGTLVYLTLWPDGQTMPLASMLNALDGIITSNMAILPGVNGKIDAYASGRTQLVLDISSYFAP